MPFYKKFGWTIIGIALTPILLFIAVALAGGDNGNGTNIFLKEIFPFGVLTNFKGNYGWIVFIQLPLYGLILDLNRKKKLAAFIILLLHIIAVIIAFKLFH